MAELSEEKPIGRQAQWRRDNPKKYAAHLRVANAIRKGVLEKKPCEVCGDQNVDAHHPDYRHPLKVRWLCRKHHIEAHRAERTGRA